MRDTLLKVVQSTMASTRDDVPDSITDNQDAMDYVDICRTVFYEFRTELQLASTERLISLDSVSDLARPNYLAIPDTISDIADVRYKSTVEGVEKSRLLKYLCPNDFLDRAFKHIPTNTNVVEITDFGGGSYLVRDDKAPEYYTLFDGRHVVTDSYDRTADDTLIGNRSIARGNEYVEFIELDEWVIDLPVDVFPAYRARVKEYAHVDIKQTSGTIHGRFAKSATDKARHQQSPVDNLNKAAYYLDTPNSVPKARGFNTRGRH